MKYQQGLEMEEEGLVNEESRSAKCCRGVLVWLPGVFSVLCMVLFCLALAYLAHKDQGQRMEAMRIITQMETLLLEQPILQIESVSPSKECSPGFEEISLGQYHGTKPGCLCEDKVSPTRACVFNRQCTYVLERKPRPYRVLEKYKVCVRRAKQDSWLKASPCPSGYTTCAYQICIKNDICPTTKIDYISPIGDSFPSQWSLEIQYQAHQRHNSIVGLEMVWSPSASTCLDDESYQPPRVSGLAYPLQVSLPDAHCGPFGSSSTQDRVVVVDKTTFWEQNNLTTLYDHLPFFKTKFSSQKDDKYSLLSVSRPSFQNQEQCSEQQLISQGALSPHTEGFLKWIFIYVIVSCVMSVIVMVFGLVLICLRKSRSSFFSSASALCWLNFLAALLALIVLFESTMMISHSNANKLQEKYSFFKNAIEKNCLHNDYQPAGKVVLKYFSEVETTLIPSQIALSITALLYLFTILAATITRACSSSKTCSPL